MKRYFLFLFMVCFIFALCSCASQNVVIQPTFNYEENAVKLHIFSDKKLNYYDNSEHALHLCVYQLKEPNAFKQLSDEREGIYKLLECNRFDQSVADFDKIVVQPEKETIETFDRAEGAKYVGIAAGYYTFQVHNMTKLFEVPVIIEKQGWVRITELKKPGTLNIDLYLGAEGIEKAEVK